MFFQVIDISGKQFFSKNSFVDTRFKQKTKNKFENICFCNLIVSNDEAKRQDVYTTNANSPKANKLSFSEIFFNIRKRIKLLVIISLFEAFR